MAWVTAPTIVSGQTAAVSTGLQIMATDLNILGAAWTSYTPALTAATTNPTGVSYTGSAWIQAGKLIIFRAVATLAATTGTGAYSITLPTAPKASVYQSASGTIVDTGTGFYGLYAPIAGTTVALFCDPTAGGALRAVTPTVPFTLGNTDVIVLEGFYEAA